MKPLILASNSPRRRELLAQICEFEVIPSAFEEKTEGLGARETALAFAAGKAREVLSRYPDRFVLGADTVVFSEGKILGKPKDKEDAKRMLRSLSGRTHSVFTGVCLAGGGAELCEVAQTQVTFYPLTEEQIEKYVDSGLPLDKAGAYGIQDGFALVESYRGEYSNVVGLPLQTVRAMLKKGNVC